MKERHYPRFPQLRLPHVHDRSSWLTSLAAAASLASLALLGTGCPEPADLDNPEMYPKRGGATGGGGSATGGGGSATGGGGSAAGGSATGGGGSATGGGGNLAACETACMATILTTCAACHSKELKLGMLDLSAGYTARLKDQPATHSQITTANPQCPTGDKLIDSANKDASWLLKKVTSMQGTCGDAMPVGAGLMGAELQCMQDYVSCVVAGGT